MKFWGFFGSGGFWKVQLDVKNVGGHLDVALRERAGALSKVVGRLQLVLLMLVLCFLGLRSSLARFEASVFLLVYMLLKLRMLPFFNLCLLCCNCAGS